MSLWQQIQRQREWYARPLIVGDVAVKVLTEYNRHFGVLDGVGVPGKTMVEIDPGFSFGDGTHSTTRMCLKALQGYVDKKTRMLDIGCGCGILAVAALCLGAESVMAVDRDPAAVKTAAENARRNAVEAGFFSREGDLTEGIGERFHLITANLLEDILLRLLPEMESNMEADAVAIISGIRLSRKEEVIREAERNFQIIGAEEEDGWVCLILRRKEA